MTSLRQVRRAWQHFGFVVSRREAEMQREKGFPQIDSAATPAGWRDGIWKRDPAATPAAGKQL